MQFLRRHSFSLVFTILVVGYLLFFARPDTPIHRFSGSTMGTTYTLQVVELPAKQADAVGVAVTALLDRLDRKIFSTYVADSELSLFNAAPVDQYVAASTELVEVLQIARQVSHLSAGAFDITVGPLVNLWGFGPELVEPAVVPDQTALDDVRSQIGYQHLLIDEENSRLLKTQPIVLDLSAVAKGYAVDQLADYFDELGIESYFLEVGGELKIKGFKPGRQSWIPAIEKPVAAQLEIQEIFFTRGQELAVAGSGDYRNYYEIEGVRYSHEIDPRSGRPITHNLAAVYVIHKQTAWADALATAFMIMGLGQAKQLAFDLELAAYFISRNEAGEFDLFYTEQFANYLKSEDS